MSASRPPVQVRVGTLRVSAGSAIEARRLADALPAALERALVSWPGGAVPGRTADAAGRRASEVAAEIVTALRDRLDDGGPR
ncbi:hypothetical protein [Kitasatospora cinereorecta]|uniref:Uncharacterized protein n=1 Tax=Kitasatospora cinereorecta TaxID=285560 RepID=A0ABW0VKU9_9ACTN